MRKWIFMNRFWFYNKAIKISKIDLKIKIHIWALLNFKETQFSNFKTSLTLKSLAIQKQKMKFPERQKKQLI